MNKVTTKNNLAASKNYVHNTKTKQYKNKVINYKKQSGGHWILYTKHTNKQSTRKSSLVTSEHYIHTKTKTTLCREKSAPTTTFVNNDLKS